MNLNDPGLPKVIRRLPWAFALAVPVSLAIGAGAVWIPVALGRPGAGGMWGSVGMPLAIFAPVFVAIGFVRMRLVRVRRRVSATGGRCCTACLHDISGLGEAGRCPECGDGFDVQRDQASWRKAGLLGKQGL